METGTIIYINTDKGYGFITPTGEEEMNKNTNVFFHHTQVVDPVFEKLERGQRVDYIKAESNKGLNAIDVVAYENS